MKYKGIIILMLAVFAMIGFTNSLEARHHSRNHFSLNIAGFFNLTPQYCYPPAYMAPAPVVVQHYPVYAAPVYRERIYYPQPGPRIVEHYYY